ncbi:F-box/kelch-repeat protein At3g23880-like [Vicia villosa]|uniref:F-box/kelch-repeat protein At3g23880-like n=1 Tax=Vicia villosa TaxID=3911 RepID=UPI00273C72CF|nr:F-box/kelch-repeat protein At3g23880-like [Vicia villosa]
MVRRNPKMNSEDDSLANLDCNLIPEEEDDSLATLYCNLIPVMLCVWNSLISIHKFARKHLKLSTTNPNPNNMIIMDSLPTLPFDLITEILSRLPVKMLVRFRCVCKSWNSLISDHKFSTNHFKLSTKQNLHFISYHKPSQRHVLKSYPLQSVFTDLTSNFTQLAFPFNSPSDKTLHYIVGSCHGILCLAHSSNSSVVLWNPSIRKFKELPPFKNPQVLAQNVNRAIKYGFGYDHVSHNYKVVVLYNSRTHLRTTKINVYTLSTNSWRNVRIFPFSSDFSDDQHGIYLSGTINWLAYPNCCCSYFIVSFDLGEESYEKISPPPPDHGMKAVWGAKLCVLKDCLCIVSYYDVWVMKEYGVKESWTRLVKVPNLLDQCVSSCFLTYALYVFEDDQVLLEEGLEKKLIIYNFKNHTFMVTAMFETRPEICTESLISPCS